jgi:hypothetical protein
MKKTANSQLRMLNAKGEAAAAALDIRSSMFDIGYLL